VLLIGNCGTLSVMSLCPQKSGHSIAAQYRSRWAIRDQSAAQQNAYAPALVRVGYEWRIHDARWQRDGKSARLGALTGTDAPSPGTGATQS
jgi:hypothetical protein